MSNWDALVRDSELNKARLQRNKTYIDKKERRDSLPNLEKEGWSLYSEYKDERFVKVRKEKPYEEQFENKVWLLFYSMGFDELNADNTFKISYGKNNASLTKQIDVFAFDGETAVVIECKASETPGKTRDFKTELESIGGYRDQIIREIRNHCGRGTKIKFIFATSNYILGEKDHERLKDFDIEHFDEEDIDYYIELAQHLGSSAKYQLLGRLFNNKKIDNMIDTVPAIRGTMGGHTYYSFSIEPERLLKIGYVLHRSDANKTMMPTYQRVIKKSRLNQIREFVEGGGYFPNSVIVSIEAGKRGLQFDQKTGDSTSIAQLGILHLPKKYCSAYIIDGQHRLYGYTDTQYASSNTIPVVAFENLDQEEQIRLFMEINENQKAVPKNLRNTLSADLLWASDNYTERRKALRLRVAESLGEDQDSPLYGHILIGENKKNSVRCVTMDSIEKGIRQSKFLTTFNKNNELVEIGQFDHGEGSNEFAFERLVPFLKTSLAYIKEELGDEWERGEEDQGLLTNNSGVQALLRILSDLIQFFTDEKRDFDPKHVSPSDILLSIKPLLNEIISFYKEMDDQLRAELKTQYGTNGPTQHWRYLQKAIHDTYNDFSPDGYESWFADNSKQYNDSSQKMLDEISSEIIKRVQDALSEANKDLPAVIKIELLHRGLEENEQRKKEGRPPLSEWDIFTIDDCYNLANSGSYWSDGLKTVFTRPEQSGKQGGNKAAKIKWLKDMNSINTSLKKTSYSVKQADYEYISSIYRWLFDHDFNDC